MSENVNQSTEQPKQDSPPSRAEIQLMLWDNCKYISQLIDDMKAGRKLPAKKYTNLIYFMQGQNAMCKTLLDSIKDSEIDDLTKQIAEIKAVLEKKGANQ
jgi:hypothetical protein